MTHDNKIIFIWDCDVNYNLKEENKTFPYIFAKNKDNQIVDKGIENMFSEDLFDNFLKIKEDTRGNIISKRFDSNKKRNFELFILDRNNKSDFNKFNLMIKEIERIKQI
jgi:hypothetical protein